jgi:hypothetical protein
MNTKYHNHQQLIHHNPSLIQNNYYLDITLKIQSNQNPFATNSSSSPITILCNGCESNIAEIFQVNGDYCLYCWQEITYPRI